MNVKIYTDGACSGNPGPGGWAVILTTESECKELSGFDINTTNNQMELTAVIKALQLILIENVIYEEQDINYYLYSDSAYVINAINKNWLVTWIMNGWKTRRGDEVKNKSLWRKLLNVKAELLEKDIKVKFIKVKGHSGDTFNEHVDGLAKSEILKARKVMDK